MSRSSTNSRVFDKEKAKQLLALKKKAFAKNNYRGLQPFRLNKPSQELVRENGRSTDYVLTRSFSYGCPLMCSYCYVARNNTTKNDEQLTVPSNPVNFATDVDSMILAIKHFVDGLPRHKISNQCHATYYTLDIGEYSDMLAPQLIDLTNKVLAELVPYRNLATSFASKITTITDVKRLIDCPVVGKGRIRASVAPQWVIDQTELGTAKVKDRLLGLNLAYEKGYEVHLNFSPMIITKSFEEDYIELLKLIRDTLCKEVLEQIKYEGIFLTHSYVLSVRNKKFFPLNSEDLLWTPHNQQDSVNLRNNPKINYNYPVRYSYMTLFRSLISKYLPECKERYLF